MDTFLADEGERPGKYIHEIGQPVGVRRAVELPNIHHIILVLEYSGLVIVHIQIIGSAKNCYQRRKAGCLTFSIHSIPDGTRQKKNREKPRLILQLKMSVNYWFWVEKRKEWKKERKIEKEKKKKNNKRLKLLMVSRKEKINRILLLKGLP